jgi:hypothetical protein
MDCPHPPSVINRVRSTTSPTIPNSRRRPAPQECDTHSHRSHATGNPHVRESSQDTVMVGPMRQHGMPNRTAGNVVVERSDVRADGKERDPYPGYHDREADHSPNIGDADNPRHARSNRTRTRRSLRPRATEESRLPTRATARA